MSKKITLYRKAKFCLENKGIESPMKFLAKLVNSTEFTVIKRLYLMNIKKPTELDKRIITELKKLCPKKGLFK